MSARLITLFAAALLVACSASVALRDPSVPISSKAVFDTGRFAGDWHLVGVYPTAFEAGCGEVRVSVSADRLSRACLTGGVVLRQDSATLIPHGIARYDTRLEGAGAVQLWVLWVDDGYRTAVIGDPEGRIGWVLNRDATIPSDRWAAAKELLDFNGYDPARITRLGQ